MPFVKKIYLVQPTYRDFQGRLLQGRSLFMHSLSIPALSALIPDDWEKEFCLEYFEDVDYETDASVIGISCMVCDVFRAREIAAEFKKRGKIVLIGGGVADLWKSLVGDAPDTIVFGNPGRAQMASILADAEEGCLESAYRCGMDVDYPFDYSVFAGRRISFMPALSSIGCTNHCEFCCTAAMGRGKVHLRRLDDVMADLHSVRRRTRRVAFVDTNLYNSRDHLVELCERMIAEDFGFFWGAECTISVGEDPEVLRLLRRAGCRLLVLGIESFNQENLRDMKKPNEARLYVEQIRRIRDAGIYVGGFFVFGFDGDDLATAGDLVRFIRDAGVSLPFVNILTPIPGTRLFERMKAEGRMLTIDDEDFLRQNLLYDTPMYRCQHLPKRMSPEECEQGHLELRRKLSTFRAILGRCMVPDPMMAAVLFRANLRFRTETRAIERALRDGAVHVREAAVPSC